MMNELMKEKELIEERKIMSAIHRQAKERYCMDKGRNYLRESKKNTKKEWLQHELEIAILLLASTPLFIMLMFIATFK